MHRYAYLLCFFVFCSNAHANTSLESPTYLESTDSVTTVIRIIPEYELDRSEIFESAPDEAMEEEPFLEYARSSASDRKHVQQETQTDAAQVEAAQLSETLSKKHKNQKQVRCVNSAGGASYYWQPQAVASGGRFNPDAMTAAHKTLPFGHQVRVTNIRNGKSVVVTINDRGPYTKGRVIDLSRASFKKIASLKQGVAQVKIESVGCEK